MVRARKISKERGPMGTWMLRIVKAGVIAALLGVIVLGIFVAIARGEIDSFEDLKASPNGQMIRIRAADGTVIQSLGPSFGRWLTIDQLPSEMKDAMVAVEDRQEKGQERGRVHQPLRTCRGARSSGARG
jgi:penicillin-binding protein 1A